MIPEVDYPIVKIERLCIGVEVHCKIIGGISNGKVIHYLLPSAYGEMVTEADIEKMNSGELHYTIVRKVKKCRPTRIRFDHKRYRWDLQLGRV